MSQSSCPDGDDEQASARRPRRRIELETMGDYRPDTRGRPPVLLLGYAQMPESAIRAGVRELAKAVRAARTSGSGSSDGIDPRVTG